jgi:hypothetical protein
MAPSASTTGPIGTQSSVSHQKKTVNYTIYDVQSAGDPENTVGNVGDLYRDGSGRVWFKTEDGWIEGEDEVTKHPYIPAYLVFRSRGNMPRWVSPITLRGRKCRAKEPSQPQKRLREEDEEEEEELEEETIGNV